MPLIVPDLNPASTSTTSSNNQQEWMTKLMGKKISDAGGPSDNLSFAKQDLPQEHRIVEPGTMLTQDYKADRLNVHLGEDGTVRHVDFK